MKSAAEMWAPGGAPALFGGAPCRAGAPIGTAQLATPPASVFHELMGWGGSPYRPGWLVEELERQLADFHAVRFVVPLANASFGLLAAMSIAAEGRAGAVAMPSFSYRGLPYIARMLNREIVFIDVHPTDGTLDPEALAVELGRAEVAAVLAVHNVDRPARVQRLGELCAAAGVPIAYDSIYSLGNRVAGRPCGSDGLCEVYSLHATKLLNGFEGGYLTTNDPAVAARARAWVRGDGPGAVRCPLSPVHAAAALASLGGIGAVVAGNRARMAAYRSALRGEARVRLWEPTEGGLAPEHRNDGSVLVEIPEGAPLRRDQLVALLCAEGYLARPYYGPALHQVPAWRSFARAPLPVTEYLAPRVLQLPVGCGLTSADAAQVVALLSRFLDDAARIQEAFRLTAGGS